MIIALKFCLYTIDRMQKTYLTAEQLLNDSFALARMIIESGYRPTFLLGIWRGGAPIAIAIHEALAALGIPCDHDVVRISSYTGIDNRTTQIKIHNIDYLKTQLSSTDRLLIVDDVHDTGLSMQALIKKIRNETKIQSIKIATTYFKPQKNKASFHPDFYVSETNDWLVFPHELIGLSQTEIENQKPGIRQIKDLISRP